MKVAPTLWLTSFILGAVFFAGSATAHAYSGDSPLIDNDGDAEILAAAGFRPDWREASVFPASVTRNFQTFETLAPYLSTFLEQSFDYYILVNTAEQGSSEDFIRPQHLRVIEKRESAAPVFPRTASGALDVNAMLSWRPLRYSDRERAIYGFDMDESLSDENRIIYKEMPVSTGADEPASSMIRTYSGIFRANHIRSRNHFNPNPGGAMSWSIYIDHVYPDGREAGLAVHGTPFDYPLFGYERSSHGCVRTHPEFAKRNYPKAMSAALTDQALPDWPRNSVVPSADARAGRGGTRPGQRVLILLFDGFSARHN